MRYLKTLAVILIVLLVSVIALLTFFQVNMKESYKEFLYEEINTISMFDRLNEDVVQSLPPLPLGSTIVESGSVGINAPMYEHGRWLRLQISSKQSKDFIIEYYQTFFRKNEWQINTNAHAFNHLFYYKGTSCIEIRPPGDLSQYYEIVIWHDFRNQSFSPKIPDQNVLALGETGQTEIAKCP